jgi:rhamnosyltransferase
MKPFCSIVIRAYNEEKHIGRLLAGITQQTVKDVQIILVDSGSTDSTLEIAAHYPVDILHISPEEFTFGRSLNLGVSASKADYVVLASAHVYPVYPDWLEHLLAPFQDQQVALTYGKQRGTDHSKFSEQQIFAQWFPDKTQLKQTTPFCNNANAAIRFSLWQKHPYNESLPALEDLAWARWVFDQGFSISYVAEAEVIHVHNETWYGIYNRYRREGMAFKQIYPHENFHIADTLRLFTTNFINDFRAANRKGQSFFSWPDLFRFRFMQFWGTYRGYRQSGPLTSQLKQTFYYPRNEGNSSTEENTRQVDPINYRGL